MSVSTGEDGITTGVSAIQAGQTTGPPSDCAQTGPDASSPTAKRRREWKGAKDVERRRNGERHAGVFEPSSGVAETEAASDLPTRPTRDSPADQVPSD